VSAYIEKIQTGSAERLVPAEVYKDLPKTISITAFVDSLVNFHVDHPAHFVSNHWCPQSWIVNSAPDLDFVGCLENIKEDWQVLMDRGMGRLPHLHKTKRELGTPHTWQQMLTPQTEAKAREFYKEDFDMWPDWWN